MITIEPPWWTASLVLLWLLFGVTALASQASRFYQRVAINLPRSNAMSTTPLANTLLPRTDLAISPLGVETRQFRRKDILWSRVATGSYVALVLVVAANGFLSMLLTSPFWFPVLLVIMPFLGAAFVSRAWSAEE